MVIVAQKKQNKDIGITNPEDLKLKKVIMKDGSQKSEPSKWGSSATPNKG